MTVLPPEPEYGSPEHVAWLSEVERRGDILQERADAAWQPDDFDVDWDDRFFAALEAERDDAILRRIDDEAVDAGAWVEVES